jgi:hypothetical protein
MIFSYWAHVNFIKNIVTLCTKNTFKYDEFFQIFFGGQVGHALRGYG